MSPRDDWMVNSRQRPIDRILVANNSTMQVHSTGDVTMDINCNGTESQVSISNVLHVKDLSSNLLSVSQLCEKGHKVIFMNEGCEIYDRDNFLVATGRHINNMFVLNRSTNRCLFTSQDQQSLLWHRRLGHLNLQDLCKLKSVVNGIDFKAPRIVEPCVECLKGKQSRFPFPKSSNRATSLLELIHSDLCGPMEQPSIGRARYFITFTDDFSRKIFVYFLANKTGIREVFAEFKLMLENQTSCNIKFLQPRSSRIVNEKFGNSIKIVRTDNSTEYVNADFENFLKQSGIRFQTTTPHTPQQNGLAERMNRTIVEKARCMLFGSNLDKSFWAEAVATSVYLTNRSPSRGLDGKTPEQIWTSKIPNLSHLKIFGCKAMVHVPKANRRKWDAKSEEYIFVGYCDETKGYRLLHPISKKLVKSRDVVFLENQVIGKAINSNVLVADRSNEVVVQFDEKVENFVFDQSHSG